MELFNEEEFLPNPASKNELDLLLDGTSDNRTGTFGGHDVSTSNLGLSSTTTVVAENILESKDPKTIFTEGNPLEDRSIKNYALLAITGAISLLCNPLFFLAGMATGAGVASFRYYVAGGLQKFDPSKHQYAAHFILSMIALGNKLGEIFPHKVTALSEILPNYRLLANTAVVAHGAALGHAFVNYQLINNRFDKTA